MPATQHTIKRGGRSLLSTSKSRPFRIREKDHADKVLRHFHHRSVDSGDLFCNFCLGLNRDSTLFSERGVERHLYDSYRAKLVVMVVIGSRTANYIKLVAGDHIEFSRSKRKHVISDDR